MAGRKGIGREQFGLGLGRAEGERRGSTANSVWICFDVPRYGLPELSPAGRGVQAGIRGSSPCEFLIGLATRFIGFFRQFVQAVEKVLPLTDE
jgi:hypothetical protein